MVWCLIRLGVELCKGDLKGLRYKRRARLCLCVCCSYDNAHPVSEDFIKEPPIMPPQLQVGASANRLIAVHQAQPLSASTLCLALECSFPVGKCASARPAMRLCGSRRAMSTSGQLQL